ncbi:MAG: FkbM family methyltransferase, partial [Pigmentiphaga sp.]
GQFALYCLQSWPSVKVICIEPLPIPAATIQRLFPIDQVRLVRTAISDHTGVSPMYVTRADDSSSMLQVESSYALSSNHLSLDHVEEGINLDTLDRVLAEEILPQDTLLKIDVQGTEDKVLLGARAVLPKIRWIYVECSYQEIYVGQKLASWVVATLNEAGFELAGVYNQSVRGGGSAIQADFLFENRKSMMSRIG